MHRAVAFDPALIRIVFIAVLTAAAYFIRATRAPRPAKRDGMGSPLEGLREARRQLSEQGLARKQQPPSEAEPLRPGEQLQQPPKIQPESSWLPSLLLLALLACLCLMAYRQWGG